MVRLEIFDAKMKDDGDSSCSRSFYHIQKDLHDDSSKFKNSLPNKYARKELTSNGPANFKTDLNSILKPLCNKDNCNNEIKRRGILVVKKE